MESLSIAQQFVMAALDNLRRNGRMKVPGTIPQEMVDLNGDSEGGWKTWQPVPSTVLDAELDELESAFGIRYPELYRDFLKTQHFFDLTEDAVRFEKHLPGMWRSRLESLYRSSWYPERIIEIGLIPFGAECLMDAGPVCFDTRAMVEGDCPIVFWDHELVETDREVRPMFSSVDRMFRCLKFAAEQDDFGLVYYDEDGEERLARQRALLAEFLALDSDGAGSLPAMDYWTSFGVSLD